jgi:hypothetical protein
MTAMLTTGEQQELCQIEQGLRDADHVFAWRLTLLQGVLRRAAPGRRVYLLVLAALAAALARLAAAARWLMMALAEGSVLMDPAALRALGDPAAWPGWESGQAPRHGASLAQDRPRTDGTEPR